MILSLRQLEYIAEAGRSRSVNGAAKALNISPSSVLMAIDKIEAEFGIQIFIRRRSKGLTTTAAGERVIARIVRFLDDARAFENDLSGTGHAVVGELHIGSFGPISPHIVPPIIGELTRDHPDLSVNLHEGHNLLLQEYLSSGAVDILLTYDEGLADEFEIEPLVSAPPHAVLPADDELAKKDRVTIEELATRTLLLLNLTEPSGYVFSLYDEAGCRPNKIHRVESYEMIRSSVAAGLGIGIQNLRPLTDFTYGGLKVACRPIVQPVRTPWLVLAVRRGGGISRRAKTFADYSHDFFNSDVSRKLFVR